MRKFYLISTTLKSKFLSLARSLTTQSKSFFPVDWFLIAGYILTIFFIYLFLHGKYRPELMDDTWFLSFVHNHIVKGIETDVVFGAGAGSGGFGGVVLFGKTFTYLYGYLLNLCGWTKSHAHLISTTCIFLSAACWVAILQNLKFSKRLAVFFGLAMLLVEPFFGAANRARPDALSFLVISTALLLFLRGRYGFAGFLSMVAIEIHPVGISAFLYIAGILTERFVARDVREIKWARMMGLFFSGMGMGVLYYCILHVHNLSSLPIALLQGNTSGNGVGNILFEYFFKEKYLRHIPEFVAIVACAAFFLHKRYYRENSLVAIFFIVSLLFTIIIRRPNVVYTIYIFPAFLLLYLWVFERQDRLGTAVVLLIVYLLPQYGFVFKQNRDWDMEKYLTQVRSLIPAGSSPVVGNLNDWFAFADRPFFVVHYCGDFRAVAPDSFFLVEGESFRSGAFPGIRTVTDKFYESTEYGRFQSRGELYIVKKFLKITQD
ncbi:MAG: hypothetical protein QME49_02330 [bacterium]|nr:hypothetical protein [bacterium]